jgi:ATP-dependent Clp protease protease subunit
MAAKKTKLEQLISDIHQYGINYDSREIYLHSLQVEEGNMEAGVEHKMATTFIKNIHVLARQNSNPILVHLHSTGGNWSDGMAIFNTIRFCKAPVTIVAYAQSSSMSGVILQAADYRLMMPDCEFMMHYGNIHVGGPIISVKEAVESSYVSFKNRMMNIFAKRAKVGSYFTDRKYSEGKIKSFFDRKIREKTDWYINAQDAYEYGLCDAIVSSETFASYEEMLAVEKYDEKI